MPPKWTNQTSSSRPIRFLSARHASLTSCFRDFFIVFGNLRSHYPLLISAGPFANIGATVVCTTPSSSRPIHPVSESISWHQLLAPHLRRTACNLRNNPSPVPFICLQPGRPLLNQVSRPILARFFSSHDVSPFHVSASLHHDPSRQMATRHSSSRLYM